MRKYTNNFFIICGLLLTLAAFPVLAQNNEVTGDDSFSKKPLRAEDTINAKPLQDFGKCVKDKVKRKQIDLSAPFFVEFEGTLNQNGKLDLGKPRFIKGTGDLQIIEVVKEAIGAFSDSGLLTYFKHLGIENVNFIVQQDEQQFSAILKSSQISENKAKVLASSFNTIFAMGKATVKDEDTKSLLNGVKVSSQNKDFLLDIAMPVESFQVLIQKNLNKAK